MEEQRQEEGQDQGWFAWTPDRAPGGADHWAYRDIANAVEDFEPVDRKTGHVAAGWLRDKSLDANSETETWLLYEHGDMPGDPGRLEAYFAIRKSTFLLKSDYLPLRREKPACEIVALCKHCYSEVTGRELIRRAISQAKKMWMDETVMTLIIDAHDRETANFLYRKHVFWHIATDGIHLWLPLVEEA